MSADSVSDMLLTLREGSLSARAAALSKLPASPITRGVVHERLRVERAIELRVALLRWLARHPAHESLASVEAALDAAAPRERDAAVRATQAHRARHLAPALRHLAREDDTWWVRRTALWSLLALSGPAAVAPLLESLDDPFWRVRHAALQCLERLAVANLDSVSNAIAGHRPESAAGAAALTWLAARREGREHAAHEAVTPARVADPWFDPDPAVIAARLASAEGVPPEVWAAYLADPHESLRRLAVRRLRREGTPTALRAALRWAVDPRVPYARASVERVITGLAPAAARGLLEEALKTPALRLFALQFLKRHPRHRDAALPTDWAHDAPALRALSVSLVADAEADPAAYQRLRAATLDPSEAVRDAAVEALVAQGCDPGPVRPEQLSPRGRRWLAEHARAHGDLDALRGLAGDVDMVSKVIALGALAGRAALDEATLGGLREAHDPWLRALAVTPSTAAEVLAHDPDPVLRRAARVRLGALTPAQTAECLASRDPWLRASALASLGPDPAHLVDALEGLGARDAGVRHAARRWLDAQPDLPTLLWAHRDHPRVGVAALSRYIQGPHAEARWRQCWARDDLSAAQREHLKALALTLRAADIVALGAEPVRYTREKIDSVSTVARRRFGRAGRAVAPLALSGVYELGAAALDQAREAGVNLFFWEPGYHRLGHWLRRNARRDPEAMVVSGSYEASERAIRRDVERALRATGREQLDAFLLFWARSAARLDAESFELVEALKREGKVAAVGFSTHHRTLAREALEAHPWDVVMVRHSAAHPGCEDELFDTVSKTGATALTFSAMSYGRLLKAAPGSPLNTALPRADECYRFAMQPAAVAANIAAPRTADELGVALRALDGVGLDPAREAALRAHGAAVRGRGRAFNALVRAPISAELGPGVDLALAALGETDDDALAEVG
ncbi:MAG: HEAT repeat domain-containing protein [Myxococcales bacterium]|nr:HEAT repeat domain-containing protein [Myxococcales bacterium]